MDDECHEAEDKSLKYSSWSIVLTRTGSTLRRWIGSLGPYQSLALLAVPLCFAEPMKLAALAVTGEGHWYAGIAMIVAAYGVSLLVVERLFVIVKPKLLHLRWFAKFWRFVIVCRCRLIKQVRDA